MNKTLCHCLLDLSTKVATRELMPVNFSNFYLLLCTTMQFDVFRAKNKILPLCTARISTKI